MLLYVIYLLNIIIQIIIRNLTYSSQKLKNRWFKKEFNELTYSILNFIIFFMEFIYQYYYNIIQYLSLLIIGSTMTIYTNQFDTNHLNIKLSKSKLLIVYILCSVLELVSCQQFILQSEIKEAECQLINTVRINYNDSQKESTQIVFTSKTNTFIQNLVPFPKNPIQYQVLVDNRTVWGFEILRQGQIIVTGGEDKLLKIYERKIRKYEMIKIFEQAQDQILAVKISYQNGTIVAGGWDGVTRIYGYSKNRTGYYSLIQNLQNISMPIWSLAIADDGQYIFVPTDNSVIVYQINNESKYDYSHTLDFNTIGKQRIPQMSMTHTRDGVKERVFVAACTDSNVRIYRLNHQTNRFQKSQTLYFKNIKVTSVSLSQFNGYLAIAIHDGTVYIYKDMCNNGKCQFKILQTLTQAKQSILSIRLSAKGQGLVTGGVDCILRIYFQGSCDSGYYLEGGACLEKSNLWIIGAVLIGAFLVGLIVLIIFKLKKKLSKNNQVEVILNKQIQKPFNINQQSFKQSEKNDRQNLLQVKTNQHQKEKFNIHQQKKIGKIKAPLPKNDAQQIL